MKTSRNQDTAISLRQWWLLGSIFLVSGAASLVYQVLWMKELSLLFGSTAQAAATTLTAFFLGLALGGWAGGKIANRLGNPLRGYGVLELCIALSALLYFALFDVYTNLYPRLYQSLGHQREVLLLLKFLLGIGALLPASFFIGGTLPLLGQHVVRSRGALGRAGSALYAINTLGAVVGVYLAGFQLPPRIGFDRTYFLAMAVNVGIGLVVLMASGRIPPPPRARDRVPEKEPDQPEPVSSWRRVRGLAFLTGFVTLALEVLWTHMFAQVLHNSVYTFSIILITFLAALAAGSLLAHVLIRRNVSPTVAPLCLLGAGAVLVAASPFLFNFLTDGLSYHAPRQGWVAYQLRVFGLAGAVIFLPTLFLGSVFPYLLRLSEDSGQSAGRTIGNLVAINTTGAILGSLSAGFGFLGVFGLWRSIRLIAALALYGIPLVPRTGGKESRLPWGPVLLVLLVVALVDVGNPALVKVNEGEELLQVWEGSSGVVAVVRDAYGLRIKVDNHYGLGGSESREYERRQGMIPLILHPAPQDVFFLGLGTGISAGAAMQPAVRSVTVCELVPDAITAAKKYFYPFTDGLFADLRTEVLAEDGGTFLRATGKQFDVIVSDLFVPWKAGVGNLYSRELFETAQAHLKPGGIFAQWLPLFQMSQQEFDIIARTMLDVFPRVTVWRGDFSAETPILCLIGQDGTAELRPDVVLDRLSTTPDPEPLVDFGEPSLMTAAFILGYCGNLTRSRSLISDGPLNTDDKPLIEYLAPIAHRREQAGETTWFLGDELLKFLEDLHRDSVDGGDPYLAKLTDKERGYTDIGFLFHKVRLLRAAGRESASVKAQIELDSLIDRVTAM